MQPAANTTTCADAQDDRPELRLTLVEPAKVDARVTRPRLRERDFAWDRRRTIAILASVPEECVEPAMAAESQARNPEAPPARPPEAAGNPDVGAESSPAAAAALIEEEKGEDRRGEERIGQDRIRRVKRRRAETTTTTTMRRRQRRRRTSTYYPNCRKLSTTS